MGLQPLFKKKKKKKKKKLWEIIPKTQMLMQADRFFF